jgi:hypothetical protein
MTLPVFHSLFHACQFFLLSVFASLNENEVKKKKKEKEK